MKIFWPNRSNAKGFSIKDNASKYHEKIAEKNSDTILNQLLDDRNLKFKNVNSKKMDLSSLSNKKVHWANRDFSEYWEVA